MMKFTFVFFMIIFLSISSVYSFGLAPRRVVRPTSSSKIGLTMAWGLQKLGTPVINIQTASVPVETGSLFGRKQQTNGNDERVTISVDGSTTSDHNKEKYYDELASLELNFRKQSLLMGLSSQISEVEKVDRIKIAVTVDGLLPSSLASSSIGTVSMKSGGLTCDWDFDF